MTSWRQEKAWEKGLGGVMGRPSLPSFLDVPLLVVGDGVRPGRVDAPVGHATVAETLLRAAEVRGAAMLPTFAPAMGTSLWKAGFRQR